MELKDTMRIDSTHKRGPRSITAIDLPVTPGTTMELPPPP